jgi:glycerol-3-phosphate acyltransferase PlsX
MMRAEVMQGGPWVKLGAWLMQPALRRFKRRTDYAETGGAPLVGVEGVAFLCHGGSDARAIKNALLVARDFAQMKFENELTQAVANHAYLWADESNEPSSKTSPGSSAGGLPS